jgi:hypothetical protein
MLQNRYECIGTTLDNKARDVITTDRFGWFQTVMALKLSESETCGKERDPEEVDEREGEILGEGLFYTN